MGQYGVDGSPDPAVNPAALRLQINERDRLCGTGIRSCLSHVSFLH
jgi:hypothetical protein